MVKIKKKPSEVKKGAKKAAPESSKQDKEKKTMTFPKQKLSRHVISSKVSQVCGLIDPFCNHARGAKFLDESSTRTLPYTYQWAYPMSSDANGAFALFFAPRIGTGTQGCVASGTVSGSGVTTNVGFDPSPISVLTGATGYRVVSAGMRIKCTAPRLSAAGMIHIRSYADPATGSLSTYVANTYSASNIQSLPLVECHDIHVILPHSAQLPQVFYPIDSQTVSTFMGAGFCPTSVCLIGGAASTSAVYIEFIMHVEYVFDDSAGLALAATPAPKFDHLG